MKPFEKGGSLSFAFMTQGLILMLLTAAEATFALNSKCSCLPTKTHQYGKKSGIYLQWKKVAHQIPSNIGNPVISFVLFCGFQ